MQSRKIITSIKVMVVFNKTSFPSRIGPGITMALSRNSKYPKNISVQTHFGNSWFLMDLSVQKYFSNT